MTRDTKLMGRNVCVSVAQSCLTLCNPMDSSLPGSSIHGISQARTLEWAAIPSSRGSSDSGILPSSLPCPALARAPFHWDHLASPLLQSDGEANTVETNQ